MIKVFISQPMGGRAEEEILEERTQIKNMLSGIMLNEVEILDTYFTDHGTRTPLQCLAESLKILDEADCAVFAQGWENSRGCIIEQECCLRYGIPIFKNLPIKDNGNIIFTMIIPENNQERER